MNKTVINKSRLLEQIINQLEGSLKLTIDAADQAHKTATHSENIAENRHDTLGLEAAYLAQGQSQRVAEGEAGIESFKALRDIKTGESIIIGTLVTLTDEEGDRQFLFIGPASGGLELVVDQTEIIVITASAPLGQALLGHIAGEEITFTAAGKTNIFEITAID